MHGGFESEFPLGGVTPARGENSSFTIGGGGAEIALITFDGDIRVFQAK